MKIIEYVRLSRRTVAVLPLDLHMSHMRAGLITEYAELIDAFKKAIAYKKPLDLVNISEEVGDFAFYIAGLTSNTMLPDDKKLNLILEDKDNAFIKELTESVIIPILKNTLKKHGIIFEDFSKPSVNLNITGHAKLDCLLELFHLIRYPIVVQLLPVLETTAWLLDIDLEKCLENNIIKLIKRYPEKFDSEKALNRDIENELNHF